MNKFTLKTSLLSLSTAVLLGLSGCSSGGGGSDSTTSATTSSGAAAKGPFKQGSSVVAYQLVNGVRDINITTTTSDSKGTFSFGSSIPWSGPTEYVISGEYLNENTGTYMLLPANKGLAAVSNIIEGTAEDININILTNIAAPGIKADLVAGTSIETAKADAQASIAELFNLDLGAGVKLTDLDLTDSTENVEANTQLLVLSAALLSTANPEQVMEDLAADMADGSVDNEALAALDELKEEAAAVDLQEVATVMEEADIGVTDAPSVESALNGTLSFNHTMSFTPEQEAFKATLYTSAEMIVNGIIGESGAISIVDGEYSIDGGAFVTAAGTVANGQKVRVKRLSSAEYATTVEAKLTIGGGVITYSIATQSDPFVADTTPNAFSFGFKRDQALGDTNVTSDAVIISGINAPTPISIDIGSFSVNGGVSANVNNGDTVVVTHTASATAGTQVTSTLTVGGVTSAFSSFTVPADTTPDVMTFVDMNDVNSTATPVVISAPVRVTGINTAADISVVDGDYSINGGACTNSNATVDVNDTVSMCHTTSADFATSTTTLLTIGNSVSTFTSTTMSDPFVPDTTPNEFSFATKLGQAVSADLDANITVSGINTQTPISITNGTYSVNGGGQDANVSNGDVVVVTQTTSANFDTENITTLTIGGVSATFKTKTLLEDKVPDDFSFDSNMSITTNTVVTSNSITITGINTDVSISVDGGTYSIGSAFTDVDGTVSNGTTIALRHTSASTQGTSNVTTLRVGSMIRSFTTKTLVNAPVISGSPATAVAEDGNYSFAPTIGTDSGEIETWSITNKPGWMTFNTLNGLLSGTPQNADVGIVTDINITATNTQGSSTITIASLEVTNTNDAPVANPTAANITEDTAIDINATALIEDVDVGDSAAISFTQATSGIVTGTNGILTYTPVLNFFGTDSFTYTVTDSGSATATATVTVNVAAVNDMPVLLNDIATTQEEVAVTVDVLANDIDIDGDDLNITTVSTPANGTASIVNGKIVYTPNTNFVGSDAFSYTAGDGIVDTMALLTVTVTNVNDVPEAGNFTPLITIDEDSTYSFEVNATDADGDSLTFSLSGNPGWMNLSGTTVSGTPLNGDVGTLSGIKVLVTDGIIATPIEIATFDVTVVNTNDAPTADAASIGTLKNSLYRGTLPASDVDVGDTLIYTIVDSAYAEGSVTVTNSASGAFEYNPAIDFLGEGNFTFKVTDANGTDSNIATVNISVTDAVLSIVATDDVGNGAEDNNITINVLANDVTTNETTTGGTTAGTVISAVSTPSNGTATILNGEIVYTPNENYNGTDSFTYTAQTLSGNEDNATVNITVTAVNDLTVWNTPWDIFPNGLDEDFTTQTLELNATDNDGPVTYTLVRAVDTNTTLNNSTLTINSLDNWCGSAIIDVNATQDGITVEHSLMFNITCINDAPVANADVFNIIFNQTAQDLDILSNDTDVDNDMLSIVDCNATGSNGGSVTTTTFLIDTYTPVTDFIGTETFECTISDATGLTSTAQVTMNVSGNHAPTTDSGGSITMVVGETITGIVTAQDIDNDNLDYNLTVADGPIDGSVFDSATQEYGIHASGIGQAQIIITITDDGTPAMETYAVYNINIIASQENSMYEFSDGETMTSAEFDALSGTLAIPADTKLHSIWGIDTNESNVTLLNTGSLEFISGVDQIFSMIDNGGESNATYDSLAVGGTSVYSTLNLTEQNSTTMMATVKLLATYSGTDINGTNVPTLANITMPDGAVVYKMAVKMAQDEYDINGPAEDWIHGNPLTFATLSDMIEYDAHGLVDYSNVNHNRAIVFANDQNLSSGTGVVVEIDTTDGNIVVVNANAGTWNLETFVDDNDLNINMVRVIFSDSVTGYNSYDTILIESGASIDSKTTAVVYKGDYGEAGRSQFEYRFNDVAMAVLKNTFAPITSYAYASIPSDDMNETDYNTASSVYSFGSGDEVYELEIDFDQNNSAEFLYTQRTFTANTMTYIESIDGIVIDHMTLDMSVDGSNVTTFSVGGTDVYEIKVLEILDSSAITAFSGFAMPETAVMYKTAGKNLLDDAWFDEGNATIYDTNGTEYTYASLADMIADTKLVNEKTFAIRYVDENTSYALAFGDNNASADSSSGSGVIHEVEIGTQNFTVAGSWEIIPVNGENVLVVDIDNPDYYGPIAYALDGNTIVQRGGIDRAGTVNISYLADPVSASIINSNFSNGFYAYFVGQTRYFVNETGAYADRSFATDFTYAGVYTDENWNTNLIMGTYMTTPEGIVIVNTDGSLILNYTFVGFTPTLSGDFIMTFSLVKIVNGDYTNPIYVGLVHTYTEASSRDMDAWHLSMQQP